MYVYVYVSDLRGNTVDSIDGRGQEEEKEVVEEDGRSVPILLRKTLLFDKPDVNTR